MLYFDVDLFINVFSKKNIKIETKHISDWIECSIRHIQKFAKSNDIPYSRVHGIKYYEWNETSLKKLSEWINHKQDEQPEQQHKPIKPRPRSKSKKVKYEITFETLQDVMNDDEIFSTHKFGIRYLQNWARDNNIAFEYHAGRKYYVVDDDVKKALKETLGQREKFTRHKK